MAIILKVVSHQRQALGGNAEQTVDRGELWFGRGADCHWVLPDPERYISGRHGRVFWESGGYFVADTSTNGIFLNDSASAIGKGNVRSIASGDRLAFGDYEIEVADCQPAQGAAEFETTTWMSAGDAGAGLAGGAAAAQGVPPAAARELEDWPDLGAAPASPAVPAVDDDWPLFDGAADADAFSERRQPGDDWPDLSGEVPGAVPDADALGGSDDWPDPLAPASGEAMGGAGIPAAFDDWPEFGDPLADARGEAWGGTAAGGNAEQQSPLSDAFRARPASSDPAPFAPEPALPADDGVPAAVEAIPEDWDRTGLFGAADFAGAAAPVPPVAAAAASVPPVTSRPGDERIPLGGGPGGGPAPGRPAAPPRDAARDPGRATTTVVDRPALGRAAAEQPAQAPVADGGERQAQLAALLRGAGMRPEQLDAAGGPVAWEALGGMLRVLLQGVMDTLSDRARIKNEFRMEQTIIRPVENNPLKLSPTVDEALRKLFGQPGSAYLGPVAAAEEAVADIRVHQAATNTAMQAAVERLLQRLDPEQFQEKRPGGMRSALGLSAGKAGAWENYCRFYGEVSEHPPAGFRLLFGEDFIREYELEVKRLQAARRGRPG